MKTGYISVKDFLNKNGWKFFSDDEKKAIRLRIITEDLPIDLLIFDDEEKEILHFYSTLDFKFEDAKSFPLAIAVNYLSSRIPDGEFIISEDTVRFRLTLFYKGSEISDETIEHIIHYTCAVIDKYDDRLSCLARGSMGLSEFIKMDR